MRDGQRRAPPGHWSAVLSACSSAARVHGAHAADAVVVSSLDVCPTPDVTGTASGVTYILAFAVMVLAVINAFLVVWVCWLRNCGQELSYAPPHIPVTVAAPVLPRRGRSVATQSQTTYDGRFKPVYNCQGFVEVAEMH